METEDLKRVVLDALDDMKALDHRVIDVRERTSVTDYMVIASGTSSRHVRSVAEHVILKAKEAGVRPYGSEGREASDWILVDLGDIVVHVMMPAARALYDLENFWQSDAEASEIWGGKTGKP